MTRIFKNSYPNIWNSISYVCIFTLLNNYTQPKFKNMKNTNTLRKLTVSLRWYFRDFFSISNGYTVLSSNF